MYGVSGVLVEPHLVRHGRGRGQNQQQSQLEADKEPESGRTVYEDVQGCMCLYLLDLTDLRSAMGADG